jgi:hypothetical protein
LILANHCSSSWKKNLEKGVPVDHQETPDSTGSLGIKNINVRRHGAGGLDEEDDAGGDEDDDPDILKWREFSSCREFSKSVRKRCIDINTSRESGFLRLHVGVKQGTAAQNGERIKAQSVLDMKIQETSV